MKRFYSVVVAMTMLALSASAQYGRYDDRGQYGRQPNYGYQNGGDQQNGLIGRVQSDLGRAAANSYTDRHERKHFDTAQRALADFENRWSQGRFDRGRLDAAISSLNHLVDSRQLNPRDRSLLSNDMFALRQFREARGGNYGNDWRR